MYIPKRIESRRFQMTAYLDFLLRIGRDGQLCTSFYDKCDEFSFHITTFQFLKSKIRYSPAFCILQAKSRKYQGVFEMKNRVKTWQVLGIWSQQLEHKQVPQWGTEPGVWKGKRSLLACHTRCICSMENTHNR